MGKPLKDFGMITEAEYVGKTYEDAKSKAEKAGLTTRIVEKDGNAYMLTMDLNANRINFRVRRNIVTAAYGG
jgi:hypothetical protein